MSEQHCAISAVSPAHTPFRAFRASAPPFLRWVGTRHGGGRPPHFAAAAATLGFAAQGVTVVLMSDLSEV